MSSTLVYEHSFEEIKLKIVYSLSFNDFKLKTVNLLSFEDIKLETVNSLSFNDFKPKTKNDFPLMTPNWKLFTYFPSMTSNWASQIGKHPQPTTRSVVTTEPLSRYNSNTITMPGFRACCGGSTVKTLWSIWQHKIWKGHYIKNILGLISHLSMINWPMVDRTRNVRTGFYTWNQHIYLLFNIIFKSEP